MKVSTFFDFCSGIGGGRLGLTRCGLNCVGSSDTSRLANRTYDLLFDDKTDLQYGNLKRIDCNKIPNFDVMIAGFPCQTFSVIGRQEGTKDPRGQIIYHLINILKNKKPRVFIFENVKGLVTHDKGKTFNDILDNLNKVGYSIYYKVLNSIDYGVPHMRQRIYIVGFDSCLGIKDFIWPEIQERVQINSYFNPSGNCMSEEDYDWFTLKYLNNEKNIGKFKLDEILEMDNVVIDTRMSDLRLYQNRMPTLRAHRDGIYYVKNKKIYYLTGEEALKFQGFDDSLIKKVTGKVSNRHLLQQAGNAMTANVIYSIGKAIINRLEDISMSWKTFEEECTVYLNTKYGSMFEQKGESDSTVSDIFFYNKDKGFYIEAKMPNAQCGQFVLLPDLKNQVFSYSSKNKTKESQYTKRIMDFMNDHFDEFCDSGTSGKEINMDKSVFYDWIINYYKGKGVEFFITKDNEYFVIFPIEQFPKYFYVKAKYREKKSGSSSLNNANLSDFINAMNNEGIEFSCSGLDIISNMDLDGRRVKGDKYDYLLRSDNGKYKVRKLSNTRNANVIFSIELKEYSRKQQKEDISIFEKEIGQ